MPHHTTTTVFCTHPPGSAVPHETAHTTTDVPTHTSTGSGKRFQKSLGLHRIARVALVVVGVVGLLVTARRRAFLYFRLVLLGAVELDVGCDDLFVARLKELVQPVVRRTPQTAPSRRARAPRARRMAMGVCTLVAAATAEVISPNAPHGAPVASVGGCDSVLNALVRRWEST